MSVRGVSAPEERQYPYWRRNLKVLPLSNLIVCLGFGISWPFLPLIVRGLGVQERLETWVGYMALGFYVVSFVMNPIWGGIADHYGRKIMVLRATVGMGFFMMLVPFAPTPLWFACLLMLVGVFNGSTAAAIALLVANTPPRRIGRALSLAQSGKRSDRPPGRCSLRSSRARIGCSGSAVRSSSRPACWSRPM